MAKFKDYKQTRSASLFPLDLGVMIKEGHLVRQIDKIVERISIDKLSTHFSAMGTPPYHPAMMLKVLIYAYSIKTYSSRNIAALMRQDITFMWLSGMQTPDHNTVNRFRSVYLKDVLEDTFTEVLLVLHEHDYIKFENYFIDGTKLEADAGKYTHVWKKNSERYLEQVQARIKDLFKEIEELNNNEDKVYSGMDLPQHSDEDFISNEDIEKVAQIINNKLQEKADEISKKDKITLKSKINKLNKEKEKQSKYQEQKEILGERNSYSKTDTDATMMRMKNTDELRPGYNAQVSTENVFVTNFSISQNAADNADFVEHLNKTIARGELFVPKTYTGDSAYGSEENYEELQEKEIDSYLKYNTFHKEQKGEYINDIFNKLNFAYNLDGDYYICPNNKKLIFKEKIKNTTKNGFQQNYKVYQCENCSDCELKSKCTKSETNRTIRVNENLERHKSKVAENLNSEKGIQLRKRRGPETETFFGDLKHNQKYERFMLRGLEKVNIELALLCIAYNLRKFTKLEAIKQKNAA